MSKEILLPPAGMMTDEGAQRVSNALRVFDQATADVANFLETVWEQSDLRCIVNDENIAEADRLIELRHDAQDEMLRAIAGYPPAQAVAR